MSRVRAPSRQSMDLGLVDAMVQISTLVSSLVSDTAARHDLSAQQIRLLGVLRDRRPTMAQLGNLLDCDKSSTTGLIDRAQKRGLVDRHQSPVDGRSIIVDLTPKGRALVERGSSELTGELVALSGVLSEAEQGTLSLMLSRILIAQAVAGGVDLTPEVPTVEPGEGRAAAHVEGEESAKSK